MASQPDAIKWSETQSGAPDARYKGPQGLVNTPATHWKSNPNVIDLLATENIELPPTSGNQMTSTEFDHANAAATNVVSNLFKKGDPTEENLFWHTFRNEFHGDLNLLHEEVLQSLEKAHGTKFPRGQPVNIDNAAVGDSETFAMQLLSLWTDEQIQALYLSIQGRADEAIAEDERKVDAFVDQV